MFALLAFGSNALAGVSESEKQLIDQYFVNKAQAYSEHDFDKIMDLYTADAEIYDVKKGKKKMYSIAEYKKNLPKVIKSYDKIKLSMHKIDIEKVEKVGEVYKCYIIVHAHIGKSGKDSQFKELNELVMDQGQLRSKHNIWR